MSTFHGVGATSFASFFGVAGVMNSRRPHWLKLRWQIVAALLLAVGYHLGTESDGVPPN